MKRQFPLVVAGLCLWAISALGQVTTGRIEGSVVDPQGSAVAGAAAKVVNTATGQILTTSADENGLWAFPSMATSLYTVTVSHPGFKTVTVENVKVDAGVPATVRVKL